MLHTITIFCGANEGNHPDYLHAAGQVGKVLAERNIHLVYGGGRVGLMGRIADAALAHGGKVTGVIPDFLQTKEIAHPGLSHTIVVASMHERKLRMHELSDGVIALPGAFGTLDELFEMLTWAQLGLHAKPIVLLNVREYFSPLIHFLDATVGEGFLRPQHRHMLLIADTIESALEQMHHYQAPTVEKWIRDEGKV